MGISRRNPLPALVLPLLAMLGVCLLAGAELEAALAAGLGRADAGARSLLMLNVTLASLGLPALGAGAVLLRALLRRRRLDREGCTSC